MNYVTWKNRFTALQQSLRRQRGPIGAGALIACLAVALLWESPAVPVQGGRPTSPATEPEFPMEASLISLSAFPGSPVVPLGEKPVFATFLDPTVKLQGAEHIWVGQSVYMAPYAELRAAAPYRISIMSGSNLQDNVLVDATHGPVAIGHMAIIAHGAKLFSSGAEAGVSIASEEQLPEYHNPGVAAINSWMEKHSKQFRWGLLPAFVGFNAVVDSAVISDGSMVGHLAKVGPGVVLKSGLKVKPGKHVQTQEEADSPDLGKVEYVTEKDLDFMKDVIQVNQQLSSGYAELYYEDSNYVRGIGYNPGLVQGNEKRSLPVIGGKEVQQPKPAKDYRVIGRVVADDLKHVEDKVSVRADEGQPMTFSSQNRLQGANTFHALHGTQIKVGQKVIFEKGAIVHGGPGDWLLKQSVTEVGHGSRIGADSVVFQSKLGDGVTVGERSLVMSSVVPSNTVIPPRQVWIHGAKAYDVEW
jgi:carbonic anhydrase/acetyltransferase-like protein (isoleucine patch superfamily)